MPVLDQIYQLLAEDKKDEAQSLFDREYLFNGDDFAFEIIRFGDKSIRSMLWDKGINEKYNPRRCFGSERSSLSLAVECGNTEVAKEIVLKGANLDEKHDLKHAPLFVALLKGNIELARFLLDSGAKSDLNDKSESILHLAAKAGDLEIFVRILKSSGFDINLPAGQSGLTPLHYAVSYSQNLALVKYMIDSGARDQGTEPEILYYAARGGNIEIFKHVHGIYGGDINKADSAGLTMLQYAFQDRKNLELIKYLINSGARTDVVNENGASLLFYAAAIGSREIFTFLHKDCGLDLHQRDSKGYTPLYYAVEGGKDLDLVQYLLESGAVANDEMFLKALELPEVEIFKILYRAFPFDVNKIEMTNLPALEQHYKWHKYSYYEDNLTLLYKAVQSGNNVGLVKYLLEIGARTDIATRDGRSILHFAAQGGNREIFELVLQSGMDINIADQDSHTPLYFAAQSETNIDLVRYLLENGAKVDVVTLSTLAPHISIEILSLLVNCPDYDVNQADEAGKTLLHHEVYEYKTVELLLRKGANPTIKDNRGRTPLHILTDTSQSELGENAVTDYIIDMLCDYGADINARDQDGYTPLINAASTSNGLVAHLLERGADAKLQINDGSSNALYFACAGEIYVDSDKICLLEYGAEPNYQYENGNTLALYLSQGLSSTWVDTPHQDLENDIDALEKLYVYGADFNIKNNSGNIPIIEAISRGRIPIVRELVKGGADINIKDAAGRTALEIAYSGGARKAYHSKALLFFGADIPESLRDNEEIHEFLSQVADNIINRANIFERESYSDGNIFALKFVRKYEKMPEIIARFGVNISEHPIYKIIDGLAEVRYLKKFEFGIDIVKDLESVKYLMENKDDKYLQRIVGRVLDAYIEECREILLKQHEDFPLYKKLSEYLVTKKQSIDLNKELYELYQAFSKIVDEEPNRLVLLRDVVEFLLENGLGSYVAHQLGLGAIDDESVLYGLAKFYSKQPCYKANDTYRKIEPLMSYLQEKVETGNPLCWDLIKYIVSAFLLHSKSFDKLNDLVSKGLVDLNSRCKDSILLSKVALEGNVEGVAWLLSKGVEFYRVAKAGTEEALWTEDFEDKNDNPILASANIASKEVLGAIIRRIGMDGFKAAMSNGLTSGGEELVEIALSTSGTFHDNESLKSYIIYLHEIGLIDEATKNLMCPRIGVAVAGEGVGGGATIEAGEEEDLAPPAKRRKADASDDEIVAEEAWFGDVEYDIPAEDVDEAGGGDDGDQSDDDEAEEEDEGEESGDDDQSGEDEEDDGAGQLGAFFEADEWVLSDAEALALLANLGDLGS